MLIFEDGTSELIDLDFRGSNEVFLRKLALFLPDEPASGESRRPGRRKLEVVAGAVTLLPRHWEWLNSQPGGASVALRKLVEAARRTNEVKDRFRQSQEATYRFMLALAGDENGFEEATRALFAGNQQSFHVLISACPRWYWIEEQVGFCSSLKLWPLALELQPEAFKSLESFLRRQIAPCF